MSKVARVHYEAKDQDSNLIESTRENGPVDIDLEKSNLNIKIIETISNMNVGETKNITLEPDEAYGNYSDDLLIELKRSSIPESIEPENGMRFKLQLNENIQIPVVVTEVNEETIKVDGNHSLAGKKIHFEIELVSMG